MSNPPIPHECGTLGEGSTSLHSRLGLCPRCLMDSPALWSAQPGCVLGRQSCCPQPRLGPEGQGRCENCTPPRAASGGAPLCGSRRQQNRLGGQDQGTQGTVQEDSQRLLPPHSKILVHPAPVCQLPLRWEEKGLNQKTPFLTGSLWRRRKTA